MKKFSFLLLIIGICHASIVGQKLISAESIASFSAFQLTLLAGIPVENGVEQFKVLYEMDGIDGTLDTVSGLLVVPLLFNQQDLPVVLYQHPTSTGGRNDVPSSGDFSIGSVESIAIGAYGFFVFATDYLGLGESRGFHPFVHAATEVAAGVHMMSACLEYLDTRDEMSWDSTNLFVAGYSQGGHSSMALHQELESEFTDIFPVTAAAHMSGPYSLSDVMLDKFLSDSTTMNVADMVFLILGYQSAYQTIFDSLSQVFRSPYVSTIDNFYHNQYALSVLEVQLQNLLIENEGQVVAKKMLQPEFVQQLEDPQSEIIQIVKENDTYNWAPDAPTRLYYCRADERVPFENSTLADSVMNANGAMDVESININDMADHVDCTFFALLAAIDFFKDAMVPVSITNVSRGKNSFKIYPNPTHTFIHIDSQIEINQLEILSVTGQLISVKKGFLDPVIDVSSLDEGMYYLKIYSNYKTEVHPLRIIRS